ncbi:Uncharacterised protein [BD1-7 clade bacterium]|uniref:Uncharacterized protein n=1 Tax=BD1-7 clade bacterium TaxID=2029982 RepID=A0A5S9QNK2_9GAMM|nr:Uncharacterised protein [BD1-7 clade bacterium]CAA0121501.1 Uncharacterised protein [BD1-7 clade bacterium]
MPERMPNSFGFVPTGLRFLTHVIKPSQQEHPTHEYYSQENVRTSSM